MATYTSLEDLQRILLSTRGEKIRFSSNSLTSVRVGTINSNGGLANQKYPTFGVNSSLITINPTFHGFVTIELVFSTPTDFSVYRVEEPDSSKNLINTGSTSVDYESPDEMFVIPSAAWTGTPEANSVLILKFQAHLSDDHIDEYIAQSETMIDAYLKQLGYIQYQTDGAGLLFDPGTVPSEVQYATAYYTAYFIFTDVFLEVIKDDSDATMSLIHKHKVRAEDFLKKFFTYRARTAPKINNFPPLMTKIGVKNVGNGREGRTSDINELSRDPNLERLFEV